MTAASLIPDTSLRLIVSRSGGGGRGDLSHLISPSDLGRQLKPFVMLAMFDADSATFFSSMSLHPHSGIGALTVFTEGDARFDDPYAGTGTIGYGGVEWMQAGGGALHGEKLSKGSSERIRGYQLWLALPPELENGPAHSQYLEADAIPQVGPARVIMGSLDGVHSPVSGPDGIDVLLVRLRAGQVWTYTPPAGREIAFVAVSRGRLLAPRSVVEGELAVFERGAEALTLTAGLSRDTVFVIGSATPHDHDLVIGGSSIHTSRTALEAGQARIAELRLDLARN